MDRVSLHHGFYKFARFLLTPVVRYRFNYQFETAHPKHHPYIVLSNHTTNWDPLMVSASFPRQMYFVATEHIFRQGLLSKLLQTFVAPIMRLKTRTEMHTARIMLRTLKDGENVCMFAEGSTTWNGETSPVVPSTAKLVKRSGVALITYRLEGGYLSLPRWSKTIRKGAMRGYVVHEYPPEQLAAMTVPEIEQAIAGDIYFNAFAHNETAGIHFRGKRMAEHLELTLYYCPLCGEIGSLHSADDLLTCASCGLTLRYNTLGRFEGLNGHTAPFDTVLEWDKWQIAHLYEQREQYLNLPPEQAVCSDEAQDLYSYEAAGASVLVGSGRLSLYKDRLELKDEVQGEVITFSLREISDMSSYKQTTMLFTVNGKEHFEVCSAIPRSTLKYLRFCHALGGVRVML